jgi:hypothetical protein
MEATIGSMPQGNTEFNQINISVTCWQNGKTHSEDSDWRSEGWSLDKASQAFSEIRINQRTGTRQESLRNTS